MTRSGLPGNAAGSPAARRRTILAAIARTVLTLTGMLILYFVLPLNRGFGATTVLTLVAGLLAFSLLVAWQVRGILRSSTPALRAVESVALSIPLFLLVFAAVYVVLGTADPGAFSEKLTRTDNLYFVMTVFSTVGFGDITPVSEAARALTTVQMAADLVLIGLVLRVFLSAVDQGRRRTGSSEAAEPEDEPHPR